MNLFLEKIEDILNKYAKPFTPNGSDVKAVVHQWVHAIAYGNALFGKSRGVDKAKVIRMLKKGSCYSSLSNFKSALRKSVHLNPKLNPKFTFIDLFAGIGGMRQGFESIGGSCVFSSEFNKNAQETYYENYGEFPFGDITKIANQDNIKTDWLDAIPNHDILIAGFPCQPFSHAGLKLGVLDTRGTLFDNISQIMELKKPKVVLLENVRGLISHDKGKTLKTILRKLISIGYKCMIPNKIIMGADTELLKKYAKSMILHSKDFGVPQNRPRIYIVLWRKNINFDFEYPLPTNKITSVGNILENKVDEKYTISDRLWAGHKRRKIQNKKNGKGFGYGLVNADSEYTNTISARYYKDGSECLIFQGVNNNPRKITPREAARLQGFPEKFIINKSEVQAYIQFGNSVSIPVVKAVASVMEELRGA